MPVLTQLLAAPVTRTIKRIPPEVRLDRDDGMPSECVLTLDNVRVVRPSLLTDRITTLSAARMREVCDALAFATGCER